MAQGNAARSDTSMEDILASIRRIIDESDRDGQDRERARQAKAAPANDVSAAKPTVVASPASLAEEELSAGKASAPTQPITPTVARNEAASTAKAVAPVVEPEDNTVDEEAEIASLAGVLARLDAEIGEKRDGKSSAVAFDTTDAESDPDIFSKTPAAPKDRGLVVQDHEPTPGRARAAKYDARFSDEDRSAFQQVAHALGGADASSAAPLMSKAVSQSVAQSFSQLAEAFEAGTGRELTGMAEQLLKPMLQDWLDNNLPQIVERLVRAEIERVARGE